MTSLMRWMARLAAHWVLSSRRTENSGCICRQQGGMGTCNLLCCQCGLYSVCSSKKGGATAHCAVERRCRMHSMTANITSIHCIHAPVCTCSMPCSRHIPWCAAGLHTLSPSREQPAAPGGACRARGMHGMACTCPALSAWRLNNKPNPQHLSAST